ncbi:MAG TPA: Stp1/IreP family PP2C-type Ser/Thr phosphatase [Azospira sp.]|nr:Stp1/IreP family PP2C-type Ser/Thr phosphatase [Azospira sp.]
MSNSLSDVLEIVAKTDPGKVRSQNEDAVFANPHLGLAILADGMGGYSAGEVASAMAVTLLSTEIEEGLALKGAWELDQDSGEPYVNPLLQERIVTANSAIFHAAQSQPQYAGMGTTLLLALFADNGVTVAHIGDSRLYRLRDESFTQVTRDHSLLQEQIDCGLLTPEQARFSQNKNLVTRALGVDPEVEPEIHSYAVEPGDIFLFCSDGLNDMVEDEDIARTLRNLSANLELAADQLVQMANDHGGRDNVSVILVKIRRPFPAPRGWWSRILGWFK